ncbi:DUF4260 domain-containing protein [Chelativorans sp. Marseille-P2723]|uniref:DUF4260 domain-containing protein n=1 Tax=Chelativorans sp. Marseille-P2723 TaxID=2709133 RepID=UPI00156DF140|nr:DUF4260 domain-containing protein [Chelativorans sp. Marseille-P2723]
MLLRIENAALLLVMLTLYQLSGASWWIFLLLILAPDLSMLGYLRGPRLGAWCYNALHSWIAPVLVFLAGLVANSPLAMQIAIIMGAHIAADRMLGYGLKHERGFRHTHLGSIGG